MRWLQRLRLALAIRLLGDRMHQDLQYELQDKGERIAELRAELRVAKLEVGKLQFVCARDQARMKAEAAEFMRREADAKAPKRR